MRASGETLPDSGGLAAPENNDDRPSALRILVVRRQSSNPGSCTQNPEFLGFVLIETGAGLVPQATRR